LLPTQIFLNLESENDDNNPMKKCVVCVENREVKAAKVFDSAGNAKIISLCHRHDLELFLKGQYKFFDRYKITYEDVDKGGAEGGSTSNEAS
jgi:hypothetical protein